MEKGNKQLFIKKLTTKKILVFAFVIFQFHVVFSQEINLGYEEVKIFYNRSIGKHEVYYAGSKFDEKTQVLLYYDYTDLGQIITNKIFIKNTAEKNEFITNTRWITSKSKYDAKEILKEEYKVLPQTRVSIALGLQIDEKFLKEKNASVLELSFRYNKKNNKQEIGKVYFKLIPRKSGMGNSSKLISSDDNKTILTYSSLDNNIESKIFSFNLLNNTSQKMTLNTTFSPSSMNDYFEKMYDTLLINAKSTKKIQLKLSPREGIKKIISGTITFKHSYFENYAEEYNISIIPNDIGYIAINDQKGYQQQKKFVITDTLYKDAIKTVPLILENLGYYDENDSNTEDILVLKCNSSLFYSELGNEIKLARGDTMTLNLGLKIPKKFNAKKLQEDILVEIYPKNNPDNKIKLTLNTNSIVLEKGGFFKSTSLWIILILFCIIIILILWKRENIKNIFLLFRRRKPKDNGIVLSTSDLENKNVENLISDNKGLKQTNKFLEESKEKLNEEVIFLRERVEELDRATRLGNNFSRKKSESLALSRINKLKSEKFTLTNKLTKKEGQVNSLNEEVKTLKEENQSLAQKLKLAEETIRSFEENMELNKKKFKKWDELLGNNRIDELIKNMISTFRENKQDEFYYEAILLSSKLKKQEEDRMVGLEPKPIERHNIYREIQDLIKKAKRLMLK